MTPRRMLPWPVLLLFGVLQLFALVPIVFMAVVSS